MHCSKCGTTLPEESKFCFECGQPTFSSSVPPEDFFKRPGLITLLAVLNLIWGPFILIGSIAILVAEIRDPFFAVMGGVYLTGGILHLTAGIGLLKLKPYGRIAQIILACIGLLAIPVGTVISVLVLVYMVHPGIKVLFTHLPGDELSPDQQSALYRVRSFSTAGIVIGVVVAGAFIVAWIGIIAAIAIPNFLHAVERGKQKRTLADMRSLSASLEKYYQEYGRLPEASSMEELSVIIPRDADHPLPTCDAWSHDFRYQTFVIEDEGKTSVVFGLASPGRDGQWEHDRLDEYTPATTQYFDCDIVWIDSHFVQYPEGVQTGGSQNHASDRITY